jgi:hypothetical protein
LFVDPVFVKNQNGANFRWPLYLKTQKNAVSNTCHRTFILDAGNIFFVAIHP